MSEIQIAQVTVEVLAEFTAGSIGPTPPPGSFDVCTPTEIPVNDLPRVQRILDFDQEIHRNIQLRIAAFAPLTLYGYSMEWVPVSVSELRNQRNAYAGSIVFPNYGSFYFAYIAHISTEDVTWSVTVDNGIPDTYTIPHGSGVYQKTWVIMKAKKGKIWDWFFSSDAEFQLIVQQSFAKTKAWASPGAYQDQQLFGDTTL